MHWQALIIKMFVVASPFYRMYTSLSRSYSDNIAFQRWMPLKTRLQLENSNLENKHLDVIIFANISGKCKLDVF